MPTEYQKRRYRWVELLLVGGTIEATCALTAWPRHGDAIAWSLLAIGAVIGNAFFAYVIFQMRRERRNAPPFKENSN